MSRLTDAWRALAGAPQSRDAGLGPLLGDASRVRRSMASSVTPDSALKNSVWWRGLALRANLMSTFPLDVVKEYDGLMVKVKNPGTFVAEPCPGIDITEFLYSRSIDLDRSGNFVGIIQAWNAYGKPMIVEPVPIDQVRAKIDGRRISYWSIDKKRYEPRDIWHEKQYTLSGVPLGLSPLAYAAWSMGIYQSAQEFALDWFANGALPRGVLRNTKREKIDPAVRQAAKDQFRQATQGGDIFVTGTEWEWNPAVTTAATAGFLDQKASSEKDVARYVGVPAGMLDIEISTGNITYANATQANLQFLVTELGPAVVRMQNYWSRWGLPNPWKLRLNTDALLRMDPKTKTEMLALLNANQLRTKDELRGLDNLAPYTPEQMSNLATFAAMQKAAATGPQQKEVSPWLVPS